MLFFSITELDANPGTADSLSKSGLWSFVVFEESSFGSRKGFTADFVDVVESFADVLSVFKSVDDFDNSALLLQDFADASFVRFKLFLKNEK